jgi:hypothetical protein
VLLLNLLMIDDKFKLVFGEEVEAGQVSDFILCGVCKSAIVC